MVLETTFLWRLMELLDWRYLAQDTPTYGFWILWLALGCELGEPNIGYQAARSASKIHSRKLNFRMVQIKVAPPHLVKVTKDEWVR